ncbi:MAG: acyl-ACP--UDP-N-acetylglucosamine O-acyltransferase [Deltaproteobacteria bacterium]|nr:acyl-ACP--UDP-N-acetylglucosamine O-acyltransferase [Deltaproteobacteria bacterium]
MIHKTAIISDNAEIGASVEIGPYSIIGDDVKIGANTKVGPHVVLDGPTTIGENCTIFQFCSIGAIPQDLKFHNEQTELIIGNNNTFRESVTINRGTEGGGGKTQLGDNNLLMAYSHVAHDCCIGNHVIMANSATLAGHITVEDNAIIGGLAGVHQFTRIGKNSMIGGLSAVPKDVPPFILVSGVRARPHGLNLEGLKRHQFSDATINELRAAYKFIFRSDMTIQKALDAIKAANLNSTEVQYFIDFIKNSERGITRE